MVDAFLCETYFDEWKCHYNGALGVGSNNIYCNKVAVFSVKYEVFKRWNVDCIF